MKQRGYTYLLVLFLVAGLGLITAGVGQSWQSKARREKEAELLDVGVEMARALASYYNRSPGAKEWPRSLNDLIEDRRFPTPQRHLRRVYRDPVTGNAEWGLDRQGDRIIAIYSLSERKPIRAHDLPEELGESATEAKSYQDWHFKPVMVDEKRPGQDTGGEGGDGRLNAQARVIGSRDRGASAAERE